METRALGKSGFQVSSIGLGTVSLGIDYGITAPGQFGRPPDERSIALLRSARARGVTLYDTAPAYGDAERLVGAALADGPDCVLATKLTLPREAAGRLLSADALRSAIDESIANSKAALGRVDLLQIHNATVEVLRPEGELLAILREARRRGTIGLIGASVYSEAEALAAIESGLDVIQVAYNLLDQRMAKRVFPLAEQSGVGVLVRSAFLKGALTEKAAHLPQALEPLKQAADRARELLGVDWSRLPEGALRFCLSHRAVSSVLVGVRAGSELDLALDAVTAGPLASSQLESIESLSLDDDRLLNPTHWPPV